MLVSHTLIVSRRPAPLILDPPFPFQDREHGMPSLLSKANCLARHPGTAAAPKHAGPQETRCENFDQLSSPARQAYVVES